MDKNSIIKGLQVGSLITGMRRVAKKEPVAYLYNGVQLPPLPEWDREAYPYAYIYSYTIFGTKYFDIYAVSKYEHRYSSDNSWCIYTEEENRIVWSCKEDEWATQPSTFNLIGVGSITWANFDVLNSDGSVYLAASDPIPVYE